MEYFIGGIIGITSTILGQVLYLVVDSIRMNRIAKSQCEIDKAIRESQQRESAIVTGRPS